MEFHTVRNIPYSISERAVLKRIDSRSYRPVSSRLRKSIKKAILDIRTNSDLKALFGITRVDTSNGYLEISNQQFDSGKLKNVLAPCRKAILFLTTLGDDIDRLIKHKVAKRLSYGYILDAAASVAVESGTEALIEQIEDELDENVEITLRYSPGYCDWALREQKKLFNILPHERIGVTLNKSFLMSPRKSISGLAGICRAGSLRFSGNACLDCPNTQCPYRRESQKQ